MSTWADDSEQLETLKNSLISKLEAGESIHQKVVFKYNGHYMGNIAIYSKYYAGGGRGIVVVGQALHSVVYPAKTAWRRGLKK